MTVLPLKNIASCVCIGTLMTKLPLNSRLNTLSHSHQLDSAELIRSRHFFRVR